ncbi:unnamed protein product [Amoebophrya sp. A120]|nr:unnamed protein product [Amoebophrya sp. A120]|eukprot:GSA120T00023460001.1
MGTNSPAGSSVDSFEQQKPHRSPAENFGDWCEVLAMIYPRLGDSDPSVQEVAKNAFQHLFRRHPETAEVMAAEEQKAASAGSRPQSPRGVGAEPRAGFITGGLKTSASAGTTAAVPPTGGGSHQAGRASGGRPPLRPKLIPAVVPASGLFPLTGSSAASSSTAKDPYKKTKPSGAATTPRRGGRNDDPSQQLYHPPQQEVFYLTSQPPSPKISSPWQEVARTLARCGILATPLLQHLVLGMHDVDDRAAESSMDGLLTLLSFVFETSATTRVSRVLTQNDSEDQSRKFNAQSADKPLINKTTPGVHRPARLSSTRAELLIQALLQHADGILHRPTVRKKVFDVLLLLALNHFRIFARSFVQKWSDVRHELIKEILTKDATLTDMLLRYLAARLRGEGGDSESSSLVLGHLASVPDSQVAALCDRHFIQLYASCLVQLSNFTDVVLATTATTGKMAYSSTISTASFGGAGGSGGGVSSPTASTRSSLVLNGRLPSEEQGLLASATREINDGGSPSSPASKNQPQNPGTTRNNKKHRTRSTSDNFSFQEPMLFSGSSQNSGLDLITPGVEQLHEVARKQNELLWALQKVLEASGNPSMAFAMERHFGLVDRAGAQEQQNNFGGGGPAQTNKKTSYSTSTSQELLLPDDMVVESLVALFTQFHPKKILQMADFFRTGVNAESLHRQGIALGILAQMIACIDVQQGSDHETRHQPSNYSTQEQEAVDAKNFHSGEGQLLLDCIRNFVPFAKTSLEESNRKKLQQHREVLLDNAFLQRRSVRALSYLFVALANPHNVAFFAHLDADLTTRTLKIALEKQDQDTDTVAEAVEALSKCVLAVGKFSKFAAEQESTLFQRKEHHNGAMNGNGHSAFHGSYMEDHASNALDLLDHVFDAGNYITNAATAADLIDIFAPDPRAAGTSPLKNGTTGPRSGGKELETSHQPYTTTAAKWKKLLLDRCFERLGGLLERPDARIRARAMDLMGSMSSGLFLEQVSGGTSSSPSTRNKNQNVRADEDDYILSPSKAARLNTPGEALLRRNSIRCCIHIADENVGTRGAATACLENLCRKFAEGGTTPAARSVMRAPDCFVQMVTTTTGASDYVDEVDAQNAQQAATITIMDVSELGRVLRTYVSPLLEAVLLADHESKKSPSAQVDALFSPTRSRTVQQTLWREHLEVCEQYLLEEYAEQLHVSAGFCAVFVLRAAKVALRGKTEDPVTEADFENLSRKLLHLLSTEETELLPVLAELARCQASG